MKHCPESQRDNFDGSPATVPMAALASPTGILNLSALLNKN
jgi:hypothetical protein